MFISHSAPPLFPSQAIRHDDVTREGPASTPALTVPCDQQTDRWVRGIIVLILKSLVSFWYQTMWHRDITPATLAYRRPASIQAAANREQSVWLGCKCVKLHFAHFLNWVYINTSHNSLTIFPSATLSLGADTNQIIMWGRQLKVTHHGFIRYARKPRLCWATWCKF